MGKRNENRPGYKKTRVGWIPQCWGAIKIQEAIDSSMIIGHLDGNHGSLYPRESEFVGEGVPYLSANNFANGFIDFKGCKYLPTEKASRFRKGKSIDGDVLFAHNATVGPVALLRTSYDYVILSTTATYFRCNSHSIHNKYLQYELQSSSFVSQYRSVMAQSTRNQVPITTQRLFTIKIPPLAEQKKIAEILSVWDRAIEQTRKLIEAKKRLKKGLMQQLLTGRMRFPQFGPPAKDGELPEGWKIVQLGECFTERNESDQTLPLLSITGNRGVIARNELDRKDTSTEDKSNYKVIRPRDIGYNTMRMWQGVSALSNLYGIVSPAYTICSTKNDHSSLFFSYLFKYTPTIHLFYRYSQGLVSDTLNLKFHHFARVRVQIPPDQEQSFIANILKVIDKELEILGRKINILEGQKKGLMQKLLTGEVRVNYN